MIYILFMVLTVSASANTSDGYPVLIKQEFGSYKSCVDAGKEIQKQVRDAETKVKVFTCNPKG